MSRLWHDIDGIRKAFEWLPDGQVLLQLSYKFILV